MHKFVYLGSYNRFFIILLSLIVSATSWAGIQVSPLIVKFPAGEERRTNVYVGNQSETERAYVEVIVQKITTDAQGRKQLTKITDLRKAGVLATPSKLMLQPKVKGEKINTSSYRYVRLFLRQPAGSEERRYQVNFTPKEGELTMAAPKNGKGSTRAGLRVLVAYGALVSAIPKQPVLDFSMQRKGKKLMLKNSGNLYVQLLSGKQCKSKTECSTLKATPLLAPGQQVTLDLPAAIPVSFMRKTIVNHPKEIISN